MHSFVGFDTTFMDKLGGQGDAAIADEDPAWASNDLSRLLLRQTTEATHDVRSRLFDRDLAFHAFHDLVDPLVAQTEGISYLSKRSAGGMQPADRVLVAQPRALCVVVQVDDAVSSVRGLFQEFVVQSYDLSTSLDVFVYHGRR